MRQRRARQENAPFKPFDVATKQLVETDPEAWLEYVGLPPAQVQIIDADLSTIAPEADKVLRVNAQKPYLLNIEFQSTYEEDLPERVLFYGVVERRRHRLRVKTVVLLLRPEADGPAMSGRVQDETEAGEEDFGLDFRYRVMRVWQQPVERLLAGRLATLPLAPLTDEAKDRLPAIIGQMGVRIAQEAPPRLQHELWAATFLLMGLRYEGELIVRLLKGVQGMEESTTYQMLIAKGKEQGLAEGKEQGLAEGKEQGLAEGKREGKMEEARNLLLRIGRKRFGKPDASVQKTLATASLERLEQMADRLLQVESWQELLA